MRPKGKHPSTGDLFQQPLADLINLKHPLVKLAELIDYAESAVEYVAKCADAVDVNHRVAGRPDSLNVARVVEQNLRSALARVRGGAA